MITWHETRNKTDFGTFRQTYSDAVILGNLPQYYTNYGTYEEGSVTIQSYLTNWYGNSIGPGGASVPFTHNETIYQRDGFNSYTNRVDVQISQQAVSSDGATYISNWSNSDGSSSSNSDGISNVFNTTATTGVSGNYSVTSTTVASGDHYTSTVAASKTTITTNIHTYIDTTTALSSRMQTLTTVVPTTITFFDHYEVGTVVSAEGEWLWSLTATPDLSPSILTPSVISDIAATFDIATFWPVKTTVSVPYATYGNTPVYGSFTNSADSVELDYDITDLVYSETTRARIGFMPMETETVVLNSFSSTTSSFSKGMDSSTFVALSTVGSTVIDPACTVTTLVAKLLGNDLTTVRDTCLTTTAYIFAAPVDNSYQASRTYSTGYSSFSSTYEDHESFGQGIVRSDIVTIGYGSKTVGGDNSYFDRVPLPYGFRKPNSIGQAAAIGTNLNASSKTIYYPFFSSVQSNVMSPVVYHYLTKATATDTDKTAASTVTDGTDTYEVSYYTDLTNWSYKWNAFTLNWTSQTTSTAAVGTSTVTHSSSTTGACTVGNVGDNFSTCWEAGGSVLGGYSPYSTAAEVAAYPPNAAHITTIGTDGSTIESFQTRGSYFSTAQSENMQVEQTLPQFYTYGTSDGALPIFATTRNG